MIFRTFRLLLACAATTYWHPAGATDFRVLSHFSTPGNPNADGANPYAGLIRDEAGNLYGTLYGGGAAGAGGVFMLAPQPGGGWSETLIHSFSAPAGGADALTVPSVNGTRPGAVGGPGEGFAPGPGVGASSTGRSESDAGRKADIGVDDGAHPLGALTLGANGVLYGTTSTGGGPGNDGGGTVFALHPPASPGAPWTEAVLTVFPGGRGSGAAPAARLLIDASGALYGTTSMGGSGAGSVFRLTPPAAGKSNWVRTELHVFGAPGDGQTPVSTLIADASGALYGTTQDSADRPSGAGTVYRLTPPHGGETAWTETVLYSFPPGGAFGSMPNGDLLMDRTGALFGTAAAGGGRGAGTVFRLTAPAQAAFTAPARGQTSTKDPAAWRAPGLGGPAPDADISGQPWHCTVLHSFTEHFGDGGPQGGVVFGPGGSLLGTTANAARHQQGTVYQLIPGTDAGQSWSETVLIRFPSRPAGGGLFPVGDLVPDNEGEYFGVTEMGGAGGVGTVFEIRP